MNPQVLFIPPSVGMSKIEIGIIENIVFFIALFALNWGMYKIGFDAGFREGLECQDK